MDKIKAVNPNIIVRGNVDKPYYLIEYYDLSDNEWHIGYGSYCLANVKKWLKTCFEVTNADVAPVKHGHWSHLGGDEWCCSNCGHTVTTEGSWERPWQKFCPNCGARKDNDTE